jgi:hypothetical protein
MPFSNFIGGGDILLVEIQIINSLLVRFRYVQDDLFMRSNRRYAE